MRPDKETLARLYVDERMTTRAIGAIYGVDKISICRWLARYDIPRRTPGRGLAHRGFEPPSAAELDQLLNVERIGYRGVAERYGVDFTAVTHWCRKLDVSPPSGWETRRGQRQVVWPPDSELVARYEAGERSVALGETIGVHGATVIKRLKALGVRTDRDGWDGGKRFPGDDGHLVRSTYELRVCNWLTEHAVEHAYEPRLPWDRRSRADFLANGWYVEIWGVIKAPLYAQRRARKVAGYLVREIPLVQINAHDFSAQKRGRWRRLLSVIPAA